MPSQLTQPYPAGTHVESPARKGAENRADFARVAIALGVLALLASLDDTKDTGLVAASPPAHAGAALP